MFGFGRLPILLVGVLLADRWGWNVLLTGGSVVGVGRNMPEVGAGRAVVSCRSLDNNMLNLYGWACGRPRLLGWLWTDVTDAPGGWARLGSGTEPRLKVSLGLFEDQARVTLFLWAWHPDGLVPFLERREVCSGLACRGLSTDLDVPAEDGEYQAWIVLTDATGAPMRAVTDVAWDVKAGLAQEIEPRATRRW